MKDPRHKIKPENFEYWANMPEYNEFNGVEYNKYYLAGQIAFYKCRFKKLINKFFNKND